MCAAIRLAVPALEGDVAEYMASSVVVASEDLDEPQPISSDRVASLIAPFLEDEGLDKSALSALSGAIAQLFVPAAEPEPEACPGHDDTLQQSSPQQNVRSARDSRVQKLAASNGHGRASAEGRRRSQSRGRGRSRGRGASNGHSIADLPARVAAEAAPEPEPEPLEAISAEDQQQQQEEAELLESILGTGVFHRCGQHEWEIDVEVACPASVTVEWLAGMGENQATNSFVVEHLPPLTLGIERSPGYPSRNPPQFTLRCHCKLPLSLLRHRTLFMSSLRFPPATCSAARSRTCVPEQGLVTKSCRNSRGRLTNSGRVQVGLETRSCTAG